MTIIFSVILAIAIPFSLANTQSPIQPQTTDECQVTKSTIFSTGKNLYVRKTTSSWYPEWVKDGSIVKSIQKNYSMKILQVEFSNGNVAWVNYADLTMCLYVEKAGAEGCGQNAMITEGECKSAALSLDYKSKNGYEVVNYAHLPHGCFVGHAHTDWTYTYYNSNAGVKNAAFRSICKNI